MACDISDPNITQAYENIVNGDSNWLILGYKGTRDKIFLYSTGDGGLPELDEEFQEPIHFALLKDGSQLVYIVYVEPEISGVKRARSVVHGRAVSNIFEKQTSQLTVSSKKDLKDKLSKIPSSNLTSPKNPEFTSKKSEKSSNKSPPSNIAPLPQTIPDPEPPAVEKADLKVDTELAAPDNNNIYNHGHTGSATVVTPIIEKEEQTTIEPETQMENTELETTSNNSAKISVDRSEKRDSSLFLNKNNNNSTQDELRNYNLNIKTKIQEALINQSNVKVKYNKEQGSPIQLSGYISFQGNGCYYWKRRWFVLKGGAVYFFKDPQDNSPIYCIDLKGKKYNVAESWQECLIANSFKISFEDGTNNDPYYFFSDDPRQKDLAIAAFTQLSSAS